MGPTNTNARNTTTTWRNQTQNNDHNNWKNFQSTANQNANAPKPKIQNTWSDYNDNQKINVSMDKNNQQPIRPPNFEQYQNKPTWMQQNFKANGWQQAPNQNYGQNGYNNQNNTWNSTNFGQQNQYPMNPIRPTNPYAPAPSNQNRQNLNNNIPGPVWQTAPPPRR